MTKRALITGITGQDGSYLAEFLLEKGYEVYAILRRASTFNRAHVEPLYFHKNSAYKDKLKLHYGDLADSSSLNRIIEKSEPDEIYNLGAQSHVGVSFEIPEYTADVTGLGTIRLLDAIRSVGANPRFYQASSSELFGKVTEIPQNEKTPFHPRSPYACAKAYAYYITQNYREAYGMYACNGILFNHESPRRGENFVTRKITLSLARIKYGLQDKLKLGNLSACRDWGYAKDYVACMWKMLQMSEADDYVIATGRQYSVRGFVELAAERIGYQLVWKGKGAHEKGIDQKSGKTLVEIDPRYLRPSEVDSLLGNPAKAKEKLGWDPNSTPIEKLVEIMVDADLEKARLEAKLKS